MDAGALVGPCLIRPGSDVCHVSMTASRWTEGNAHTERIQCPVTVCIPLGAPRSSPGHHCPGSMLAAEQPGPWRQRQGQPRRTLLGVPERRAAGMRPGLARVHLCHPCSCVIGSSCARPGRPSSGHMHARLFSPSPAWKGGAPFSPRTPALTC